jgi:peptide/nickel transport system permease protein
VTAEAWRRVWRDRPARIAIVVLLMLALAALFAPVLAPYDPLAQPDIIGLRAQPPSWAHPFGTDQYSRDVLSRMLHGGRVSLAVGFLAVLLSATIATAYGAAAGFVGGRLDAVMMRLLDGLLAIPRVLLLLGVLGVWPRVTLPVLILLLGGTGWFGVSRLVRAEVMAVARRDHIAAARALGASDGRLLLHHVLPNAMAPVLVAAALGVGSVIVLEAGLSYLGVGVRPPYASWGNIIQDGSVNLFGLWWMSLFPGLAIAATVLACNVVGEALRDAADPRHLPGAHD